MEMETTSPITTHSHVHKNWKLTNMIAMNIASTEGGNTSLKAKRPQFRPFQVRQWCFFFLEAKAFKEKYGHCKIMKKSNASPELAKWAKRQRYLYKEYQKQNKGINHHGKNVCQMTPERVAALNEIGFCWDTHELIWEERFQELEEFGRVYGHLNVPSGPRGLPHLSSWIKVQRRQYRLQKDRKNNSISLDRIERLEKLGFNWNAKV